MRRGDAVPSALSDEAAGWGHVFGHLFELDRPHGWRFLPSAARSLPRVRAPLTKTSSSLPPRPRGLLMLLQRIRSTTRGPTCNSAWKRTRRTRSKTSGSVRGTRTSPSNLRRVLDAIDSVQPSFLCVIRPDSLRAASCIPSSPRR